jgi:hypothetical protein
MSMHLQGASRGMSVGSFVRSRCGVTALVLAVLLSGHALAHHSLTAEFDTRQTLVLSGVIMNVQWVNPHIYVDINVPDAAGTAWHLECVPVAMARKAGLSMKTLQGNGERVTVDVFPARDGTPHLGFLARITYADGHHVQFVQEGQTEAK